MIVGLETTKALLMQDLTEARQQVDKLKELLREEQQNTSTAVKQHKALSAQLKKVVGDSKTYASLLLRW